MRGHPWTEADDRLAMTLPPPETAKRTGRTVRAVHLRRHRLLHGGGGPPWTEAEDRLLTRLPFDVAVRYIKRSPWAIDQRRRKLGLANDPPTLR
jgi:hypothetical protein